MIRLRALLSLAACALLAACDPPSTISTLRDPVADPPAQVRVGGRDLTLEAWLWRDFMPSTPPGGRPLAAVLRVKTVDGGPFPADVSADQVRVVYGDQVWTATPLALANVMPPGVLEVRASDGPKWGPGVNVNVAVRLRTADGQEHWLGAANQPIHRTD